MKRFIVDPPIWFIVPVYLFLGIILYKSLLLFLIGIVVWEISEYIAHRWILHGPYKSYHRVHHIYPDTCVSLPLTMSTIGGIFYLLCLPLACVSGVFIGYVIYELSHRLNPVWHKRHHENPKEHFGVTLPI